MKIFVVEQGIKSMKYLTLILIFVFDCVTIFGQSENIEPYKILKGHKHKVQNAFYSSDGKFIVSHGWDNTVKIWDAKTYTEIRTFRGHTDQVWCARISRDNKLIASGSLDRSFILWDVETGEKISQVQIKPHNVIAKGMIPEFDMELPNSIYSLSFSPNGKFLAVASADQLVRIWDIENSVFIDTLGGHNTTWTWVKYSPDGKYLISGSSDRSASKGETIIWETGSYNQINRINSSGDILFTDNNELGIYQGDCTMDYYALSTGLIVYTKPFPCFEGYFNIRFDKKYIASCNEDYCIRLWDLETQEVIWKYKGDQKEIHQAFFSPDGKYLIAGTPESDILVWKLEDIINNIQ